MKVGDYLTCEVKDDGTLRVITFDEASELVLERDSEKWSEADKTYVTLRVEFVAPAIKAGPYRE